ncbi:MAG: TetR/AcrR family transcriptional regulator [Sinobacterium sp.]|nr:TetR/AcrR family transcriptional regulator [Sinobacterium sp.]
MPISNKTNNTADNTSYHHGDLRQSLLLAAVQMIDDAGVESLSMRKLADAVNVSRTALYHHFDGKQALLSAIAEEGFVRQRQILQAAILDAEGLAAKELLQRYISAYINFAVQHPAYYGLMFGSQIWKTAEADDQLTTVAKRAFKNYVDTIASWQQLGIVANHSEPLRFAQVTWGTLHGLSRLMIDGIYIEQLPQQEVIDTVVAMFTID